MEHQPKAISAAPTTADELAVLVARATKGDATAVPALRQALRDPSVVEALGGNLAKCAQHSFVKPLCGDDLAVREAIYAKMDSLRTELLGSDHTPVERLLVERVVACWLQVQDADMRYAQNQKDMTIRQGDFSQRRMDAANRRYLAALKVLAVVRKLTVPALQINLARKQVCIAAAPPHSGTS